MYSVVAVPEVAVKKVGYRFVAVVVSLAIVKDAPTEAHLTPVAAAESATKANVSAPTPKRTLSVPLETIKSPLVVVGDKASKALTAVVWPVPPLAMATVPVTFDAVPVVFWLSVGTSAATMARKVGVPGAPLGAAKKVLAVWDAKSDGVTANVPPSVKLPELVTVPVRVNPLTVPAPETEVTVPCGLAAVVIVVTRP